MPTPFVSIKKRPMSKKTFEPEEDKPVDYFKKVEAAKKQEKLSTENLVTSLRSDMVLTSSTSPEKKSILQRINLKYLFGILLTLFIIILVWFMLGGPGRPILEHNLVLLVPSEATSTPTAVVPVALLPITPPLPTKTPLPSATALPTYTATMRIIPSPTIQPATVTPTSVLSACRDALTISLADVGQTLCVKGTVIQTAEQPNAFMVIFNKKPGSFYWVTYDLVWSDAVLDTCYQITAKIEKIANSPIQLFDYKNLPELCP
jgi:hypothetical protein